MTEAGINHLIPDYLAALSRELEEVAEGFPATSHIHTIYLGGGTPSILPTEGVKALLDRICSVFPVRANAEITLEINPGTVNLDYLQDLKESGVNRLSIGMQSADNTELRTLGRIHNFEQCLNTFISSKEIGFENISADLIYGIPGQSMQSWGDSLQRLLDLEPSHASLYSLTIEEGTPYAKMVAEGVLTVPEDDLLADMYEMASELLENHGFEQYEISNWAT